MSAQEAALAAGTAILDRLCVEGLFATGAQLAVSVDGQRPSTVAVGSQLGDTGLRPDHLFNVWCASKPVPAMILLALLERSDLTLDHDVADLLKDDKARAGRLSIADLLSHHAGLSVPHVISANLMSMEDAIAAARRRTAGPEAAYFSEFGASVLISDLIERLDGRPALEVLQSAISKWGLAQKLTFEIADECLEHPLEHLGFFLIIDGQRCLPMLHDALPSVARARRDVLGSFATADGLCSFYSLVGRVLAGEDVPWLASTSFLLNALRRNRGRTFDHELQKECDFAAGFMIGLVDHGYGNSVSPRAIGHTGMMGSPFGWFDPESGLAAAIVVNGFSLSPDDYSGWRPHLVNAVADAAKV